MTNDVQPMRRCYVTVRRRSAPRNDATLSGLLPEKARWRVRLSGGQSNEPGIMNRSAEIGRMTYPPDHGHSGAKARHSNVQ